MSRKRDDCKNQNCEHGWVNVTQRYLDRVRDKTKHSDRALLNSVYPCDVCQPALFDRWVERHFDAGHDPDCPVCAEARRGVRRGRSARREPEYDAAENTGYTPLERRDVI